MTPLIGIDRVHTLARSSPYCASVTANEAGEFVLIFLGQGEAVCQRETAANIALGFTRPIGIVGIVDSEIKWAAYEGAPLAPMVNAVAAFTLGLKVLRVEAEQADLCTEDFLERLWRLPDPRQE